MAKAAAKPQNAPTSIVPSNPMLSTPARSEKTSPIEAKMRGVASLQAAPISAARKVKNIMSSMVADLS
ncbi:hypothetical protein D3C71_2243170 [compost metagenome]